MYLKRLELFGFKTFSQKTEIEFSQGFLAVVGPNGSGKSNLTDAIRFCLGENSVKAMRATKLEELVFAGTPTKKGAPYAEVTAVFDNSDGSLPVELSEVAITRRLEAGGDSKFQINRTNCRLKDVHELLMGSGIGPGSFSVLGGKEVDQVLSSDPKERRLMLEETAGVNRYRYRKKEAQRRLERTAENLTRLRDILREIGGQLEESEKQLGRYEKYRQAQEELGGLERDLANHEWLELEAAREQLQKRLDEAVQAVAEAAAAETTLTAELEAATSQKREHDVAREQKIAHLGSLRERAGVARANHEALFRRAAELEHTAKMAVQRLESSNSRREECERQLDHLFLKLPEAKREFERAAERVTQLREQLGALPSAANSPAAELRQRLGLLDREQAQVLSRHEVLGARLESEGQRLRDLESQRPEMERQLEAVSGVSLSEEDLKTKLTEAEAALEKWRQERKVAEAALEETRQQRKRLEGERRPLMSRVAELEALLEDRAGLPPSVRAVMAWKVPGTVGLLGELIKVPTGLEQAFEAALGGHLNDIVTKDRRVASSLIERLKQERVGRCTFWPLDLDRQPPPSPQLPDRKGVVGLALELLGYPKEVEVVLNEILGRTVIMEDLPLALSLYDRCRGRRPHLVTKGGEYLNPSGALTGGSQRNNQTGLLARKRAMEEVRGQLDALEKRLASLTTGEEAAQTARQGAERELQLAQETLASLKREQADQQAEARRRQTDLERAVSALRKLDKEAEDLRTRRVQAEEELVKQAARKEELAAERLTLEGEMVRLQAEETRLMAVRDSMQHQVMEAELAAERAKQAHQEVVRERERWVQRQNELGEDEVQARLEQERCGTARTEIEAEGAQLQVEMATLDARVVEVGQELEAMKASSSDQDRHFEELSKKQQAALTRSRQAGDAHTQLQVKMAGVLAHAEEARLRLEEHGDPETPARPMDQAEFEKAKGRAGRLRSFLENFGSVNLGAREDHERLVARNEELTTQVSDLEDGAASLKKIMAELDQVTVTQFKEAFHRVNETFAKMFTELFCGGTARLELVTPDDYLESGVEIVACPPGKRLQNLTLLSSGERALSAMAFLLALLSCKPSPVVILDELDAPLDDANVERVAKRLMTFSTSSQFLVITHNRKTMEFADRLYGVTMEEPGSSRILSVKMTRDGEVEPAQSAEGVAHHV